ncbi:MAG: hypothetical protein ACSHXI_05695 [Hoeflea sp.]|uniref:hypothetical protein n=1 Tax=Hoeflea sp. TaxID=1940281 RepID=UPI003EF37C9D
MSGKPASIDQTITLLKIQGLLAGAAELSHNIGKDQGGADTRFLSYLIEMARIEIGGCFNRADLPHRDSDVRSNHGRM